MIGAGAVTEVKSGPAFQKVSNSDLVAVMRRTGRLAQDYAERHSVPRWTDDAQALIDDPAVDAIYVATPPSSHKEYAIRAMRAGKPVYVEKPMALNYAECQEMLAVSRETGMPLFVAYYRRTLPRFRKVKELIDSGAIGQVRLVNMTLAWEPRLDELDPQNRSWRVVPEISGGGRFVDVASHQFDLLDYLLGPISQVQGFAGNQAGYFPAEDVVTGSFVFESDVQGAGAWSFTAYGEIDETEIMGAAGHIRFPCFNEGPVALTTRAGETSFDIPHPLHVQQPLIDTVVAELLGRGVCPSHGESAARANWMMDQMLASYYGGAT